MLYFQPITSSFKSNYTVFNYLLLSVILMTPFIKVDGQRIARWSEKTDDHPDFVEGTYHQPIGGKDFRLVSFYNTFERFSVGNGQKLYFEFEAPEKDDYLLTVQERFPNAKYILESKPKKAASKNRLGPWSVDKYLPGLNLAQKDLGVILKFKDGNSPYYLPVSVSSEGSTNSSKRYVGILRINNPIKTSVYKVYKNEHIGAMPDIEPDHEGSIRKKSAGHVQISIPKEKLKDFEGWVTVEVMFVMAKNNKKKPFTFYFYHKSS